MNKFQRDIIIEPGFDRRNSDPKKNYGVHGCQVRFLLKGDLGTVQFLCFTDWLPKNVQEERMGKGTTSSVTQEVVGEQPMGADLGYHSPKPMYKGQKVIDEKCAHLGGVPCYYDGSALAAERIRDIMLERGSDGVWEAMETYYTATFEQKD